MITIQTDLPIQDKAEEAIRIFAIRKYGANPNQHEQDEASRELGKLLFDADCFPRHYDSRETKSRINGDRREALAIIRTLPYGKDLLQQTTNDRWLG